MKTVKTSGVIQRNMFEDDDTLYDRPDEEQDEGPGTLVDTEAPADDDKIEVEVVDDTPPADRGRPKDPPDAYDDDEFEEAEDEEGADEEGADEGDERPAAEASERELRGYSEAAVKRIKKLTFDRHTERRAREEAQRERDHLLDLSQRLIAENRQLTKTVGESTSSLYDTMKRGNQTALEAVTEEYQAAYDAGDAKKMAEAQRKMARLEAESLDIDNKIKDLEKSKPAADDNAGGQPSPRRQPPIHPKTTAWINRNSTWFQKPGHEEMTAFAFSVHEGLTAEGVDPTSDTYYRRLDKRLQAVYPDFFKGKKNMTGQGRRRQESDPAATGRSPVAAPSGNRREGSPRKVRLTATEVALAKRLGLTPEQYARQKLKDQASA